VLVQIFNHFYSSPSTIYTVDKEEERGTEDSTGTEEATGAETRRRTGNTKDWARGSKDIGAEVDTVEGCLKSG